MQLSTSIIDNLDQAIGDVIKSKLSHAQQVQFAVGYLFLSGLQDIVDGLEDMEQVQILIGNRTNKNTAITLGNMFAKKSQDIIQTPHEILQIRQETQQAFSEDLGVEFSQKSTDKSFLEKLYTLISSGKLQIKIYTKGTFHAKAYIFTAKPGLTKGQCIIGSSNLSKSGFYDNTELNVIVDGDANFEKMQDWFFRLREESYEFTPDLLQTMDESWIKAEPTPHEVYMKVLYELVGHIVENESNKTDYEIIKDLYQFQLDAVQQSVEIVKKYNGVFVSDVVGLGKTYTGSAILSLLTQETSSKALVLCPAKLQEERKNVLDKYSINAEVRSIDSLTKISTKKRYDKIKYVLIDESHKFKDPNTQRYPLLQEFIHRTDKKLILLSATPLNLNGRDVYHQIKLFHKGETTELPVIPNHLYQFFQKYEKGETQLSDILAELMVRRTRLHIKKHYASDMKLIGAFPKRIGPTPIQYDINESYSGIYDEIESILGQRLDGLSQKERVLLFEELNDEELNFYRGKLKYAMYDKVSYIKDEYFEISESGKRVPADEEFDDIGKVGENLKSLAKIMFYQRLESSPVAFLNTIDRIINYYKLYIKNLEHGYIFKTRHSSDLENYAGFFDNNEDETAEVYLELSKESYSVHKFDKDRYLKDLAYDLHLLEELRAKASVLQTSEDVKFKRLLTTIKQHTGQKILIFSQYSDSTRYLKGQFDLHGTTLEVAELSGNTYQQLATLLGRFSPNSQKYILGDNESEIDILLATDIIAEGQNLQDAQVVINYDLHRNPIKLIQRIGRIDRIGSTNENIYIYNFYPSETGENKMQLRAKIHERVKAIHKHIGEENKILSPDEELNEKMLQLAEKIKQGEDALEEIESLTETYDGLFSYAPYIKTLSAFKQDHPENYKKIQKMPLRMRTAKKGNELLTLAYCKYGESDQCLIMNHEGKIKQSKKEFLELIACEVDESRIPLPDNHDSNTTILEDYFIENTEDHAVGGLFSDDLRRSNDITALRNRIQQYASEYVDTYDYDQHSKIEDIISFLNEGLETRQKKRFKAFKKIKKTSKFTLDIINEMVDLINQMKEGNKSINQEIKERYVVMSESIVYSN